MKCGTTVSVYTAFISRMQHKPALALYSGCRRCLSCPVTDLQGTLSDMLDVVVFVLGAWGDRLCNKYNVKREPCNRVDQLVNLDCSRGG